MSRTHQNPAATALGNDDCLAIDEQRLLDCFLDLVRIASPSHHEGAVAAYCHSVLQQAGWQVTIDDSAKLTGSDTGNLTATLPACGDLPGNTTLFFSAHMDTVEPASGIEPVIKEGIIRSAGDTILGADDKVGIAALLEMARVLGNNQSGLISHPALAIVLSVQEEIGLNGAKAYDSRAMTGQPCFVLDAAGSPGTVVIGAPYQRSFRAAITGRAAHAGVAPEQGVSAIEVAAAAIGALKLGRLDARSTANVGTIEGGTANNIVAESCIFTGECRSHDLAQVNQICEDITTIIKAQVQNRGACVDLQWEDNYQGFSLAANDPLVAYCLLTATALGLSAGTEISGGGADTNVYAARGAKALSLGTGMTGIHGTSESLALCDLTNLARYVLALAKNYSDFANDE